MGKSAPAVLWIFDKARRLVSCDFCVDALNGSAVCNPDNDVRMRAATGLELDAGDVVQDLAKQWRWLVRVANGREEPAQADEE